MGCFRFVILYGLWLVWVLLVVVFGFEVLVGCSLLFVVCFV